MSGFGPRGCIGKIGLCALIATASVPGFAQATARERALRAAIHPVADMETMGAWLSRVPLTRDFPDDFAATLQGQGPAFMIEMSTTPGCIPCGDLWGKLVSLGRRYGWRVQTISAQEAMVRSGRLGMPWVGHPTAWVRPVDDAGRIVPVAIGTDHPANLARNLYLAAKMLTGVRPAVGVRAMSKFTGIMGVPATRAQRR